jgi:hypothetical protein
MRGNREVRGANALRRTSVLWLGLVCGAGHYLLAAVTFGSTVTIVVGMYLVRPC